MKKRNLLFTLSVFMLASCSMITPSSNGNYEEGIVDKAETKQDVKELYNDSLDTTEDLEEFNGEDEEITDAEEEQDTNGENDSSSEEIEENTPEEIEITSYHIDYTIDYALQASVGEHQIINSSEQQAYSLTYVNDNGDVFMELNLTHYYVDTTLFFGEVTGEQSINIIYQDEKLYIDQTISNSFGVKESRKTSHDINLKSIYKEYSDYFLLMSINSMLDPTSRDDNNALVDQLLTNESVKIIDVTDKAVTVEFDYEDGVATMVFDTELKAFTSITFDKSKQKDDIILDDDFDDIGIDEDDSLIDDDFYLDDEEDYFDDREDELEDFIDDNEYKINIDLYRYLVNINFSYNDQVSDKLTEEEIAEYDHFGKHYEHFNDYKDYDDDYDFGYHGGKDEHHGHNDKPYHNGKDDHEDKFGEKPNK